MTQLISTFIFLILMQLTEHLLPNSMASAEEALQSTNSKANFRRLTRLLMRGGVTLLREMFDSFHPPANLSTSLSDSAVQTREELPVPVPRGVRQVD